MTTFRPREALPIESLPEPPLVLVLVGTDHHPFARLVQWAERWGSGRRDVVVHVQHGATPAPSGVRASALVPHEEMQSLFQQASAVVCHGGPATIMEARRAGLVPVVVPRDPSRGEHVDEHQQLFSRRMGREGMVLLCEDVDELDRLVERVLGDPSAASTTPEGEQARREASARRVGVVVGAVVDEARRRRKPARRRIGARRADG
ncbi:glycosyltransferase [uncultured Pseudokineococcus sp.]|uniref:glycosyltransferase n=1 Tax=uncultured Pseudokineococcus sp. TaxID=1642928 RepID=UPI0026077990|nr:glycosyltransferase [uncultured Pseudokineococcus sp.]